MWVYEFFMLYSEYSYFKINDRKTTSELDEIVWETVIKRKWVLIWIRFLMGLL